MNSLRKTPLFFIIIFGLLSTHIYTMQQSHNNCTILAVLTAGCAIGIGCASLYYSYKMDNRLTHLEQENKKMRNHLLDMEQNHNEETKRLDQTRAWAIENRTNIAHNKKKLEELAIEYHSLSNSSESEETFFPKIHLLDENIN